MIRYVAMILLLGSLQGCALFAWESIKGITVKKEEVARTPLNLRDAPPVKMATPKWIVITPQNAEKIWKQLEENKTDLVLFSLTDDGYEELAINLAEIRNYLEFQRKITEQYRKYYEPEKPKSAE